MSTSFEYVFPAIRGIQAGKEYYTSMCPLKLLPRLFLFDEEELELVPELRAQRTLNYRRIPTMAKYIVENKDNYIFSAITASINGDFNFEPIDDSGEKSKMGSLKIDMSAQFIINDGQHRRAAIEEALKLEPDLGDETISVVFFIDRGLKRCQQMFSDLNLHQIKANKSQGILYDQRDPRAYMARYLAGESIAFSNLVEMENNSLSARSRKLFTLSAIYQATSELMLNFDDYRDPINLKIALDFWNEVSKQMPEWKAVKELALKSSEVRAEYVHVHAIILHSLGIVGRQLLHESFDCYSEKLTLLQNIDWRRANVEQWEGRCMIAGRMSKSSACITLTANEIKKQLGLKLSNEEQKLEDAYCFGENESDK